MTKKLRKQYSPNDKVSILKRHLVDRVPVSDVCDQYTITPGMFYRWQQQFFENGALAFERPTSQAPASDTRVRDLEARLAHKNLVIVELSQEFIAAKKKNGDR